MRATILAVLSLAVVLAGAGARADDAERTVRIATEGASPPFNYVDQTGELQGFEIDLGKALCERAKLRCTFQIHQWDGIVKGLIAKEYDAIMSGLSITDKRRKRIAFSKPYYRMPAAFVGPKDTPIEDVGPQALAGKRIGVVEDSKSAAFLDEVYAGAEVRPYANLEEADLDLLTGRLDLVLGNKLALSQFLAGREGECCRFVADAPRNPAYYGEGVAIGIRQDDPDLKAAFDRALDSLIADGTYDRIRAKYIPFDVK